MFCWLPNANSIKPRQLRETNSLFLFLYCVLLINIYVLQGEGGTLKKAQWIVVSFFIISNGPLLSKPTVLIYAYKFILVLLYAKSVAYIYAYNYVVQRNVWPTEIRLLTVMVIWLQYCNLYLGSKNMILYLNSQAMHSDRKVKFIMWLNIIWEYLW